jgi:AmmeMemoRadiSam system protein B
MEWKRPSEGGKRSCSPSELTRCKLAYILLLMENFPKIRVGIEAIAARYEGREVLVLRDRTGVSGDLAVERSAADILGLLDGSFSVRDIQVALMRKHGLGLIGLEEIQGLVENLDKNLLLDNERYQNHLKELSRQFRESSLRPAVHAGRAYPEDPQALREQLNRFFQPPDGPGPQRSVEEGKRLIGLIVPHIDFERGGYCYAWGYSALPERNETELYVILGTCHLPMAHPFALTTKAFDTPLGRTPCAGDVAEMIAQHCGLDLFQDELAHRAEHTIEFQIVFLQHLLGDQGGFQVLPILCGGFHQMLEQRILPSVYEPYRRGLGAIMEVLETFKQRTCFIASVDLAHLGPQFGDAHPVQHSDLGLIQQDDHALFQAILEGDAESFYRRILAEGDRRRICGLPSIYTLLSLLQAEEIRLLNYGQAFHPQATVTFASLGLWGADDAG